MKFLKWLWVAVILGAIAGMGNYARKKKKIIQIRKENEAKVKKIQAKKEAEVEVAKGVRTVSDGRSSLSRMLDRARRRKRPDN